MSECLFCKIVAKQIPANIVYENDELLAFHDIDPKAPTHILLIPKSHIATANEIDENNLVLIGRLFHTAKQLAKQLSLADDGYRLVINCNQAGGQAVYHLHLHLLGGRQMGWPPG